MSSFIDLLLHRKSTRKFSDEPLKGEEVESIFKAALLAPSSKNRQPWEFIAIENKATLQELAACKSSGSRLLEGAALAIVVTGDITKSDVWIEDTSIAAILMQLQAEALGLGSCWIQIRERTTEHGTHSDDYLRNILDIPMQMQVLAIIAFGRKLGKESVAPEKELAWEKIHIEKWQ